MSEPFLFFVIVLFVLAISDLVVGVSNDAVNFLNSALGSKVATRRTVMLVASAGIFAGALFSSGMMEIARKGIFNPELFTFANVMVVFAAVMLTDIILLDLFNTLAMPTSTTVSIVFELLGASIAVALLALHYQGGDLSDVGDYINSSRALIIIAGIFLSVVIAFAVGAAAQYVSRLVFTFHFERRLKWFGGVWAGVAVTSLAYFLFVKGLKGASFVPPDLVAWVGDHTFSVLGVVALVSIVAMQALLALRVNILRFVVLFGTFALAMAFASNDLVNFVGVPMAGLESYSAWSESGTAAADLTMGALREPIRTSSLYLFFAGAVMVATLWLSSKARSVTETEINLGRQGGGLERFAPNGLSRTIVRAARDIGSAMARLLGRRLRARMEHSFEPRTDDVAGDGNDGPAFDLIRAAVNLTIASGLISLATSLKLPLSTTYVSFMVAMGTSLADRAWDRDSAVFRVAGVLNVIGGWFLTAAIALSVSALFAALIYHGGVVAVVALLALAVFALWRSTHLHRAREKELSARGAVFRAEAMPVSRVLDETTSLVSRSLDEVALGYRRAIAALNAEDRRALNDAQRSVEALAREIEVLGGNFVRYIQRVDEKEAEGSKMYLRIYAHLQDLLQSSSLVVQVCREHVRNVHRPPSEAQAHSLQTLIAAVTTYLQSVQERLADRALSDIDAELDNKNALLATIDDLIEREVEAVKAAKVAEPSSNLVFSILLESRDVVAVAARFLKFYSRHIDDLEATPHTDPTPLAARPLSA